MFVLLPWAKWLSFSGASLYCMRKAQLPQSSFNDPWQSPVFHSMSWDRQGLSQQCLATPVAFYRASLALLAFVAHTSCGRAKIPKLLQHIFLVFQDLILSKWTLLWSIVLVILIQEWPRRLLWVLLSEDKVNAIYICSNDCCISWRWEMIY